MTQLARALDHTKLRILKYDPSKLRSIATNRGALTLEKFCKFMCENIGVVFREIPDFFEIVQGQDLEKLETELETYAKEAGVFRGPVEISVPALERLILNCDMAAAGHDKRFFLTNEREIISPISGDFFLLANQMSPVQAVASARQVLPQYLPRDKPGIASKKIDGEEYPRFNTYIPPQWKKYSNPKMVDKLPIIFEKLVKHLFPLEIEREYFYSWLYMSLFKRAEVFLVLCGAPGTGKNRLKLIMRALHGFENTVDGKRSTLKERFNSQLSDSTLIWFDELSYDMDMENVMKEIQNDSIAIERKGIDATRATRIYSSLVISNNKPRDNYIAFDARKFAPLMIRGTRLEESMTQEEIDNLTEKVEDPDKPSFDIEFVAQIANWIKKHGYSKKWPRLEYKGPMFYALAHTSMSRWQKRAASLMLDPKALSSPRITKEMRRGYLWSSIESASTRKHGEKTMQFPDFTTVQYFFDVFKDSEGRQAFKTETVKGDLLGDFFIKPLLTDVKITTEAGALVHRHTKLEDDGEEYDL